MAPLQLSASGYRVAGYDRHSGSRLVCILSERGEGGAAATGVAGAMFAVRLPVTVTTSLRDGFTQTFRAP